MSDTTIKVQLKGRGVEDGSVELKNLAKFGEDFQKVVTRVAYAIEKDAGNMRPMGEISKQTALRLVDITHESFGLHMRFDQPAVLFDDITDIATKAAFTLTEGLGSLQGDRENLPNAFDQGVLTILKNVVHALNRGVSEFEVTVSSGAREQSAIVNEYTKENIIKNLSEPEERIAAVRGQLMMVNFGKDKYRCHLYYDENDFIPCTFDDDMRSDLEKAIRNQVHIIGIATIDPVDDQIETLHIRQVTVLAEDNSLSLDEQLKAYKDEYDSLASFKRGWADVREGRVNPIETLWDGIDAD